MSNKMGNKSDKKSREAQPFPVGKASIVLWPTPDAPNNPRALTGTSLDYFSGSRLF
jgi:hypothetical protein